MSDPNKLSRRDALAVVGVGIGTAMLGSVACSDDGTTGSDSGVSADAKSVADSSGAAADGAGGAADGAGGAADGGGATCTVYARQAEGPFYVDKALTRTDVTEGRTGTPLTLAIEVVSKAGGCAPLRNVAVDIWHCDAVGIYSGFPGQLGGLDTTGETFLRGTQLTDAQGKVTFKTIYPGWYPGRTTHIHFKVRQSGSEATSQLYFPEDVSADVYKTGAYASRGAKDTSNSGDSVNGGRVPPLLKLTKSGSGYTATLTVTIA